MRALVRDAVAAGPHAGTAADAVLATFRAWGLTAPRVAALASECGLELRGDRVYPSERSVLPPPRHAEIALTMRAGLVQPAAILGDVAWHAALGGDAACAHALDDVVSLARACGDARAAFEALSRGVLALEDAKGDEAPPLLGTVLRLAADMAEECGLDPRRALGRWEAAAAAQGDMGEAARAAYRRSWLAGPGERAAILESIAGAGPGAHGWDSRAAALQAIDDGDRGAAVQADKAAVRSAVQRGDGELEAAALLAVSNMTGLDGDLRTAAHLQQRGAAIAHRAGPGDPP